MRWTARPIAMWSLAWAITGASLAIADVFSSPRNGPLWVAVVGGVIGWGLAGAATVRAHDRGLDRSRAGAVVWALAYIAALVLGAPLGDWFERTTVGPLSSAGFVGFLVAWAVGAAFGGLGTAWLVGFGVLKVLSTATIWALAFFIAGWIGIIAAMVLAQITKAAFAPMVGQQVALLLGWSIGSALGGLAAGGITLRRRA